MDPAAAVAPAAGSLGLVRLAFGTPDLRRIQLALAGSVSGSWMYSVALGVYAFDRGGADAVAAMYAVRMGASAIASPVTSPLADRMSRRRVMLASDLLRGVALVAATAAVAGDAPLWLLGALVGAIAVIGTPFQPAQAALLPSLVRDPVQLSAANAVSNVIENAGIFLGPALGAAILAAAGPEAVFASTTATVVWSALLVARLRPDPPPGGETTARPAFLREVVAGVDTIVRHPTLRVIFALVAAATIVIGALNVLIVVLALDVLETGDAGVGVLLSAVGLGGLFGALPTVRLVAERPGSVYLAASLVSGLSLVGMAVSEVAAVAVAGAAAFGAATAVTDLAETTLTQRAVPQEVLGRVFGVMMTIIYGGIAAGSAIAPSAIAAFGPRGALVAVGAGLVVLTLACWRPLAAIDDAFAAPDRAALLRRIEIFAPLAPARLEQLARSLQPVTYDAGEAVFAEGDAGDDYYVVESGEVDVTVGGDTRGTLGPGEGFGEIALLRPTPRTATVTARTPATLLALGRVEFLAAVTGHAGSAEAANALVVRRLEGARQGPSIG